MPSHSHGRRATNEPMTLHPIELHNLQIVSERVARARDLDTLLAWALAALDDVFGFAHGLLLVPDDPDDPDENLVVLTSHGYNGELVGAEVSDGDGWIGLAAKTRTLVRGSGGETGLIHTGTLRGLAAQNSGTFTLRPLPGLAGARSHMAIPLLAHDRLIGVLALECKEPLGFAQWDAAFLQILANQIAHGIDRMIDRTADDDTDDAIAPPFRSPVATRSHRFTYYHRDDSVFVDGQFVIRNAPAKILWRVLRAYANENRTVFSHRELLDLSLAPTAFDLESRLILLRKRLEQTCAPSVRLVATKRNAFALDVRCALELVEREKS